MVSRHNAQHHPGCASSGAGGKRRAVGGCQPGGLVGCALVITHRSQWARDDCCSVRLLPARPRPLLPHPAYQTTGALQKLNQR